MEKLERRESNVAKGNFITSKREYKRASRVYLSCVYLMCGVCKITSVMPYLGLPILILFIQLHPKYLNIKVYTCVENSKYVQVVEMCQSVLENSRIRLSQHTQTRFGLLKNLGCPLLGASQLASQCTLGHQFSLLCNSSSP